MYISPMEILIVASLHPFWTAICLVLFIPLYLILSDIYIWYYLPPGPFPLPFIGNILCLRKGKLWNTLEQWSETYGPIYTVFPGRTPLIVISSPVIASALLTNRGSIYSSRPRQIVFQEIFMHNSSFALLPYGNAWSTRRALLHASLKPGVLSTYWPRQDAEATFLVADMLADPETWSDGIDRFAASVVFSMAYGRRITSLDSKVLKKRQDLMHVASLMLQPGAYLVESFPFLASLPDFLTRWKAHLKLKGEEMAAFDCELVDAVRADLKSRKGEGVGSLTETMLELQAKGEAGIDTLDDRHFAAIPASLFGAGSDTTASTLHTAILAPVTHPHVQRTVQTELDAVVGLHHMPTFSDHGQLRYLSALVREVLRWRPAVVLGLPHATTRADVYNGIRIPEGTVVMGASYLINRNPEFFPSPNTFAPSRFLHSSDPRYDGKFAVGVFPGQHGHAGFDWGRRVCVELIWR